MALIMDMILIAFSCHPRELISIYVIEPKSMLLHNGKEVLLVPVIEH